MKILHITPFYEPNVGGVETHLADLMEVLKAKEDLKVRVLTYQALQGQNKGKRREIDKNVEIDRVSWMGGLYYKSQINPLIHFLYLTPRLLLESIKVVAKDKNVDVVHSHGINAAFIGTVVKKLFNKSHIVSFHVDFNFIKGALTTKIYLSILKSVDKILVLTKKSKEKLVNLGIDGDKIAVYSYWVDQDKFKTLDKKASRRKLGWKDKFSVLFVGRLAKEKGVLKLLKVARDLKEVNFYIAGSGALESTVEEKANSLENTFFLGRIENKDLPAYYSAADLVVIPSQVPSPRSTFEEGVPRVIIEAISCGTPVIGTDSGGMAEVIEEGGVGEVNKGDAKSLKMSILELKKDSDKLKKYGKNCRKYARSRFSKETSRIIISSYDDLKLDVKTKKLLRNTGDMALKRRAKRIIEEIVPEEGDKILEVGCGDGFYLHLLSELDVDLELTGVDFDKRALKSARKNLKGKGIELKVGDLMKKLPFDDNSFDKVIMSEVAEHLPDDVKGLKEVKRVLRPGGVLVLTVPNANYPLLWDPINWLLEHLFETHIKSGFFAGIWNQHERLYTDGEIRKVTEESGFDVNECESLTWWCLPFNHYLINIGARILASGGGGSLVQGANKFGKEAKRALLPKLYFSLADKVDKLNDFFSINRSGVSVLIKAKIRGR